METGSIQFHFTFTGSPGIGYPQNRPVEIPCFDERMRQEVSLEDLEKGKKPQPMAGMMDLDIGSKNFTNSNFDPYKSIKSTTDATSTDLVPMNNNNSLSQTNNKNSNALTIPNSSNNNSNQEFSDDEIIAAFKFIDLDNNNFIGAREIRHILICMGEMITDEEVDMMVRVNRNLLY